MFILLVFLGTLLAPAIADAWGPLTHIYLGYQILDIGAFLIPAGIYGILNKYKYDFLYGNLCADMILGRRFHSFEKNSHNWDIAWKLMAASNTDQQKAFAYGYLMHLCADSVVHNLEPDGVPFGHSLLEIRSDSRVDKKYRKIMKRLDKAMQKTNDVFLEKKLESLIFSFKTNKRVFKGLLVLSRFPNYMPVSKLIDNRSRYEITGAEIYNFQQQSLQRMLELLNNGKDAEVLKSQPLGRYQRKAS